MRYKVLYLATLNINILVLVRIVPLKFYYLAYSEQQWPSYKQYVIRFTRKLADRSRGQPEGSLFNSYCTEV